MSIFNSLGSNYNFGFATRTLFARNDKIEKLKLINLLEKRYSGKATLVYKGRDAIRLALRTINLKGKEVGVCGFTCFAVYDAIVKEGHKPHYIDIEKDDLNFSSEALEKTLKENPELKIVIIQNTLGYPCDIEEISKICKEKNIFLIEDLAHSIGAKYLNNKEAGTIGDFTVLSFSQDKMIDGVSGGALIVRNDQFPISNFQFPIVNKKIQLKDRLYPLLTFKIRATYALGIGKAFHYFLKRANLLSKPVESAETDSLHGLPLWYSRTVRDGFNSIASNLSHRLEIAKIYAENLNQKVLSKNISSDISNSSNLRFPIFTEKRQELINYLKKENIYISDIWYDSPIAPKKYLQLTDYKMGECPNAEKASKEILNLPTHRNVSTKDAKVIANKINLWLKSQ